MLRIDRVAMSSGRDRPFYAGKHTCRWVNVQIIADPAGRPIWASPAMPGARHDMGAAREHGIVEAINIAGVPAVADTADRAAAPRYTWRRVAVAWISTPAATGCCPATSGRSTRRTPARAGPANEPTPS